MKGRKDKWMEEMNDGLIGEMKDGRMWDWQDGRMEGWKDLNLEMEEWVAGGSEDSLKLKVRTTC